MSYISIKPNTEGTTLAVAGGNYRIIVSGEETNGNYAVIEMLVPDGGGPAPHAHPDIQEMFYVLEGEFEFKTEAGKQVVTTGGLVNIPFGGGAHCFKNASGKAGRLLCTVIPAGLDDLFKEMGELAAPGEFRPMPEMTQERMELMRELSRKYGMVVYPPDYLG